MKTAKQKDLSRTSSTKYRIKKANERAATARCTKSPAELKVLWAKALRGGL